MEQPLIIILLSGFSLAGLWVFYFWIYWQYRIDKTRQELFAIRDELFDYAADGNISFNHSAYGLLRITMNGMVRFTHKINLLGLVAISLSFYSSRVPGNFRQKFEEEVNTIESMEARKKLKEFHLRMNMVIVDHLIKSSVPLMAMTVLIVTIIVIQQGWKNLKAALTNLPGINEIDTIAAEIGRTAQTV